MLTPAELTREAAEAGFRVEIWEKVVHLLEILEDFHRHPLLKDCLALKGGTALNLFLLPLPRLSIDLDLNYVGSADREVMLAEKPTVMQAIESACEKAGFTIHRIPEDHAGGKWRLSYQGIFGRSGNLELDVNFLQRVPLWPPVAISSLSFGSISPVKVLLLDIHEIAAGKLAALFSRKASRDVFDMRELLKTHTFDAAKLRLGCVVYGGMSRRDWRTITLNDIDVSAKEVDAQLIPMLRGLHAPKRKDIEAWTQQMVRECRELVAEAIAFLPEEKEFLELLNGHGEIAPQLLTPDETLQAVIGSLPGLQWKALNVQQHIEGKK